MPNSIISEGKTSTEAIENGLKLLNATKDMVDIKMLENEDKRSFFSILAPRTIKVELTLKETVPQKEERKEKEYIISKEEVEIAKKRVEEFLEEFFASIGQTQVNQAVEVRDDIIYVEITGEDLNSLIGYRGEVLNAYQTIISSIANRGLENHCKVLVDIEGYRGKREKTLEDLASKIAKTVVKTKKSVTLEPMSAFERKVIHSKLQNHKAVKTYSVGEEPHRKIVIALK